MENGTQVNGEGGLSKLDALVRSLLLRYPSLFGTRWDVLSHLYLVIGNGYEWSNGELVEVFRDERTDEQAAAEFFSDIDKFRTTFAASWDAVDERRDTLKRRRRQFQLDNLDLIVHEPRNDAPGSFNAAKILVYTSLDYSHVFRVPDDAEPSFRDGAVEVLSEVIQGLYYEAECGRDRGVRAAMQDAYNRLVPPPTPEEREHIRQLLNDL